jgi:hypothetical protein
MREQIFRIACGVGVTFTFATALIAAPPSIVTKPLTCVAKDRNARITARIEGRVKTARVYFRALDPKCDEYYVNMHQSPLDPTLYWAVLPLVGPETHLLSYQVRVDSGDGGKPNVSPAEPLTVAVQAGCVADSLSAIEQRAADYITLGLVSSGQSGAPCGFRCDGITSILTAANELRPNEACFSKKAWYMTPGGRIALGAGTVLIGGGVFIWNERNNKDRAVSPARP